MLLQTSIRLKQLIGHRAKRCVDMDGTALRIAALGLLFGLPVNQAFATASISCGSDNDSLSVNVILGAGPVTNVVQVEIQNGDQLISTSNGDAPAVIARSYITDTMLSIDLMDDQALDHVAELRVVRYLGDESEGLQVGFAKLKDVAPIAVVCDGP